jgi:sucrose phosphorylase
LPETRVEALMQRTLAHGGRVSYKNNPDGSQSGYELNISYFDALSDPAGGEDLDFQAKRFLAAQAILLAMQGLPGIYAHSLLGSRSWQQGVALTGHNRAINRQKFALDPLVAELQAPGLRRQVYHGYTDLLRARAATAAFHPYGYQQALDCGPGVFGLLRASPDGRDTAVCLHNVTAQAQTARLAPRPGMPPGPWRDLLSPATLDLSAATVLRLEPYQVVWLGSLGAQGS